MFIYFLYPLQLEEYINKCNLIWIGLIVSLKSDSSFLASLPTKTHLVLFRKWLVSKLDLFPHWLFLLFYPNEQATMIFIEDAWSSPGHVWVYYLFCIHAKSKQFSLQICVSRCYNFLLFHFFAAPFWKFVLRRMFSLCFIDDTNHDFSVCYVSLSSLLSIVKKFFLNCKLIKI